VAPKLELSRRTPGAGAARPDGLAGIGPLPEAGTTATWSVGARVTLAALAEHPDIWRIFPALAQAAAAAAHPPQPRLATVAGNLAQPSRCRYFRRRDVQCRKKGGRGCFARIGENKYHALFAGGICVSPCGSGVAVALAALDARIVVQSGRRSRILTVAQLYADAWSGATVHNSLKPGELVRRILIPVVPGARSTYLQVSEKAESDRALVSCAASARVAGNRLAGVRIALGAVAPVPWQVEEAHRFLEDRPIDAAVAEQAAGIVLRGAAPLSANGYKVAIARALVRRSVQALVAGAP
jgi:xanthine dehydrogenase YagS FAD-binding subunit